jgi:hypothetical protein
MKEDRRANTMFRGWRMLSDLRVLVNFLEEVRVELDIVR